MLQLVSSIVLKVNVSIFKERIFNASTCIADDGRVLSKASMNFNSLDINYKL